MDPAVKAVNPRRNYMPDEGEQIQVEQQSTAGKWILVILAILFVAGSVYGYVTTQQHVQKLTTDLSTSQAQVAELQKRVQSSEAQQETESKEQFGQVTGEVAGVKTDVGGVKTDVASTKADLEATKAKLQSAVGDLGVQSGLIANTRSDLEILKHKGDRNYYEFTLLKGAKPQPVATVSLQLKKTDPKRGKFTVNVTSDDRTIEKQDRNTSEPIPFS